jgi:type I restriction enzyme S subunit
VSWQSESLGAVALVTNGKTPSKAEKRDAGHPVLKIRDVDDLGEFRGVGDSYVDPEMAARFRAKWIEPGDTLILNAAHNADYVGSKSFFVPKSANGLLATGEWLMVRAKADSLDSRYAHYWLTSVPARMQIKYAIKGIHLYPKDVARFRIPLPPLLDQQRIAGILSQADALRRLRRRSLARLNELRAATFIEMFGNPITNSKALPTQKLGTLGTLDRGRSQHRPRNDPALLGGPYPLIQTGEVARSLDFIRSYSATYSELGLRQSKMWKKGTLCITIAANIADTAILDFDACFPDSVVGFDGGAEHINLFVHSWLKLTRGELERVAPAVAQKNINLAILRDLDIIVPKETDIRIFHHRMQRILNQRHMLEDNAAVLDRTFAALQHRAFSGEL